MERVIPSTDRLRQEFALHKAGAQHGPMLKLCTAVLSAIPPTSVQPERDFSVTRYVLGSNRARLASTTLDDIFVCEWR